MTLKNRIEKLESVREADAEDSPVMQLMKALQGPDWVPPTLTSEQRAENSRRLKETAIALRCDGSRGCGPTNPCDYCRRVLRW